VVAAMTGAVGEAGEVRSPWARIYDPFSFLFLSSYFHFILLFRNCPAAEMPPLIRPHYYYVRLLTSGLGHHDGTFTHPPSIPLLSLFLFRT
jgi:hypothetical protein